MLAIAAFFEVLPIVANARTMFPKSFSADISCHEILSTRPWYGQVNLWKWLWFIAVPVIIFSVAPNSPKWQLVLCSLIAMTLGYIFINIATHLGFTIKNAPFHGEGIVTVNGVIVSSLADQIKQGCFDIADNAPYVFARAFGWLPTMIYVGWCEMVWVLYHKYKTKLINENFKIDWVNKVVVSASIILPILFLLMSAAEYLRRL